ncbi:MAG: UvrD-helicase domain-containing protein, partial [Firmicutes bacterium]|nr:UvrD-helicase domain-containing protein [Bacillota bacterium]
NDLEEKAIKLLENEAVRAEIKNKYTHIFVDEYQDINSMQNTILERCQKLDNMFFVGDVKQSIYGFRRANPQIIIEKLLEYKKEENETDEAILLEENFRSRKEILEFVNDLFEEIMTKETAGIDYKEIGILRVGKVREDTGAVRVLAIDHQIEKGEEAIDPIKPYKVLDAKNITDDEELKKAEMEGVLLAECIAKDLANKENSLKDISILVRSKSKYVRDVLSVIKNNGIKVRLNFNEDLLESKEALFLHNFLVLINNREEDIPLISVLSSPLYKLSFNAISKIKLAGEKDYKKHFFEIFWNETNTHTAKEKLEGDLNYFYELSQNMAVSDLARAVSNYFEYEENAKLLNFDVYKISRYLEALKNLDNLSLFGYVNLTRNGKLESKGGGEADDDAISVNTIHSSKGLEYPIVYLINADKTFNTQDTKKNLVISEKDGIAINNYLSWDDDNKKNLNKEIIKDETIKASVAEEIRLLYVALTRAEKQLTVVGMLPKPDKKEERSFMDLIFSVKKLKTKPEIIPGESLTKNTETRTINNQPLMPSKADAKAVAETKAHIEKLEKKEKQEDIKNKYGVTGIVGNQYRKTKQKAFKLKVSEDEILDKEKYNNENHQDIGNAYHRFLELFNFNTADYVAETERTLKELTVEERSNIDRAVLDNILSSKLMEILKSGKLLREQRFIVREKHKDIFETSNADSKVLVQGVVDALVVTEKGFIIVDYKYSKSGKAQLIKDYKPQLEFYKKAAERILKKNCIGLYLFNIKTAEIVAL